MESENDSLLRACTVSYYLCNEDLIKNDVPKEIGVPVQRLILVYPVKEEKFFLKYHSMDFAWSECDCVERPVPIYIDL